MSVFFNNTSGDLRADRRYEMALEMIREGDLAAAEDLFRQGIELAPQWPPLHFQLGEACRIAEKNMDAEAAFRSYLALDPEDHMGAVIKLSLMGRTPAPEILPASYVQSLFDQYAPRFEQSLVGALQYNTPSVIQAAVLSHHNGDFENVLDLGCGTGLAAELFVKDAKRITGIDISPAMIEIARAKNIYDSLHVAEIEDFLNESTESFDLIMSADVFVYFGALEKIFEKIAARIKQGLFAFSVQTLDGEDWALGHDHRYAHGKSYVMRCIAKTSMKVVSCEDVTLRMDAGNPVLGSVFLCSKA